jgi:hypothetical protein
MLTLPVLAALAAVADTASAAGAVGVPCDIAEGVACTLQATGVREPAAIVATLTQAALYSVADVAELNGGETAELLEGLRAAAIPLGDRARLRKASEHGGTPQPFAEDEMPCAPRPLQDTNHRRLQRATSSSDRGGDVSIEVVAIAFTGLIGMVGYAVQSRSAQKASKAQASLGREAAERDKAEAKAGKQLERVQLQMAEWVRPFTADISFLVHGWISVARQCKLLGYLRLYSVQYVPQPATPYIELLDSANPAWWAAMSWAPFAQLPPEDLALLTANSALRSRYCELTATVLLPALRRLSLLFATKTHLNESIVPGRLDPLLPGIGRSLGSLVGTLSNLYWQMQVYVGQFESLVERWSEEQFDLLQPETPGLHVILIFLCAEQLKDVATKEVELVGASSGGSSTAVGGLNFMKSGMGTVGDGKEAAET